MARLLSVLIYFMEALQIATYDITSHGHALLS